MTTTYYELLTALAKYAPNASVDMDNDGQVIIYTNLMELEDGFLTEFVEED